MIGNIAYMFYQPDQVLYYQRIFDGGKNFEFSVILLTFPFKGTTIIPKVATNSNWKSWL